MQTFSYEYAALFSKDEQLVEEIQASGEEVSERVWPLPMWDSYKEDLKSDVADVRNYHGKPVAGAIMAAKFLETFTSDHLSYAHLDIAGVAFGSSPIRTLRSATGYGVKLLTTVVQNLSK